MKYYDDIVIVKNKQADKEKKKEKMQNFLDSGLLILYTNMIDLLSWDISYKK